MFVGISPAQAYVSNRCKWCSQPIKVDSRYVNGNFYTAIKQAIANYDSATDISMTYVDASGPGFSARNASYGATGWEGNTTWNCVLKKFNSADAKLNMYYLPGTSTTDVERLRVVWLHELGHGLSLGHVANNTAVMYTSASQAYFNGVRYLTSDEIAGINSVY